MRRRHTTGSLLGLLPSLVNLASNVRADGVTWISPAAGDVYNSGDTIVGQWTSNSSFSSPSFSLCTSSSSGGDGSSAECGSAVWPLVETNGDTKMVHLYAWKCSFFHNNPHVNAGLYLQAPLLHFTLKCRTQRRGRESIRRRSHSIVCQLKFRVDSFLRLRFSCIRRTYVLCSSPR